MKNSTTIAGYNRARIMKRAWVFFNNLQYHTFSEALTASWKEAKDWAERKRIEAYWEEERAIATLRQKWDVQPKPEYWMNIAANNGADTSWWG